MRIIVLLLLAIVAMPLCAQTLDTADIRRAVERQLHDYPESSLQDIYKSFYQNRFGIGHMITDSLSTEYYLLQELEMEASDTASSSRRYWEPVGADTQYVRVFLRTVADGKLTAAQLNDAFVRSAQIHRFPSFDWATEWQTIMQTIVDNNLPVTTAELDSIRLAEMSRSNTAAHHSQRYNAAYHPRYRVVRRELFEKMKWVRDDG